MPDDDLWSESPDASFTRDPNWRTNLLGATPGKVLSMPVVRYVQIKMDPELATLISGIARSHGMSREKWMRRVIAERVAAETGQPFDDIWKQTTHGTYMRDTRPERARQDEHR